MKKLVAILFVWLGCAAAWLVLGSTLVVRSGEVSSQLRDSVHQLWGPPIEQRPPTALLQPTRGAAPAPAEAVAAQPETEGALPSPAAPPPPAAPIVGSRLDVKLDLEHRKKGLMWFPTYEVAFDGRYTFANEHDEARRLEVTFPLEKADALYEGFEVLNAEGQRVRADVTDGVARFEDAIGARSKQSYRIRYRSRGTSRFSYQLTAGTGQVEDFELKLATSFSDVDFPQGTLSPSSSERGPDGFRGTWKFASLVASSPIGVELPQLLNPGPLASKITFFAPVSLLFFFFVVAILGAAQGRQLDPLHYFFLGCAFFAFHLLFAYLVDHVAIAPAFVTSALVSTALVVTYARWFVGWKFALREMGLAQLIYLVLFSFSFFWTGFTGLAVTIGAILTLFLMMQITGKLRWGQSQDKPPEIPHGCRDPYRCAPPSAMTAPAP